MQQLSLFRGVHDTQPRPVTLEELVTMMRTDQSVRDLTEKHRYARSTGDEQGASRYKKMMASFGVAARFEGGRQQKHIVEFTGLSLVDIDHIAPERMTEILEKVREDEHTLLAYTTMSGKGLRVLFRYQINENVNDNCYPLRSVSPCSTPLVPLKEGQCSLVCSIAESAESTEHKTNQKELSPFKGDERNEVKRNGAEGVKRYAEQYKQVFEQGNKYYSQLTGLATDHQCKNVGRISTIAYDENLYYNPEATPFIVKLEEKKPVGRPRGGKSEKGSVKRCKVGDVEHLVQRELERRGIVYEAGTYNKYVSAFCYEMNRYGVPEEECREWAVNRFDDYNTPDVASIVRSCYQQTEEHGTARPPKAVSDKQATVAQIEAFLAERVQLRRNVVTGFVEILSLNEDDDENENVTPSASLVPLKEGQCSKHYTLKVCASERDVNSFTITPRRRGVLASVATKKALAFPRSCDLSLNSQSSTTKLLTLNKNNTANSPTMTATRCGVP